LEERKGETRKEVKKIATDQEKKLKTGVRRSPNTAP
jgi:hypothetical protein